jgi:hypothetical protein
MQDPYAQYLTAIHTEITTDPTNQGYAGRSDEEITVLLNTPYVLMVPQEQAPRIAVIINQIPFAPNNALLDHVTLSQQQITPQVALQAASDQDAVIVNLQADTLS